MSPSARTGDGRPINPGVGVIPIMKEVTRGKLAIIGTGFYVARYGLFLTAQHVLEDLVDWKTQVVGVGYVCHPAIPGLQKRSGMAVTYSRVVELVFVTMLMRYGGEKVSE